MSIKLKLTAGFGSVVLLIAMLGMVAGTRLIAIDEELDAYEAITLKKREALTDGLQDFASGVHYFKNFVLRGGDYAGKFEKAMADIESDAAEYRDAGRIGDDESRWLAQIGEGARSYRKAMEEAKSLAAAGKTSNEIDRAIKGADKALNEALLALLEVNANQTQSSLSTMMAAIHDSLHWVTFLAIFIVAVSALAGWAVGRSITRPLARIMAATDAMSNGDMSANLKSDANDEIGRLMACMGHMQATVGGLLADVAHLIEAASAGDLNVRADPAQYRGDFGKLLCGINATVDNLVTPLRRTADYVGRIAKGEIPETIVCEQHGEYRQMCDSLNALIATMNYLRRETRQVIKAVECGELDRRADADGLQGDWRELVAGVNRIVEGIVEPLEEVAGVLKLVERGDLTRKMQGNYRGRFGDFKDSVNATVQKLSETIADVVEAADLLDNASKQIGTASLGLSKASNEQATSVEETSSAIEQMAASINQNSENAKITDGIAAKASKEAVEGGEAVKQTVEAMKAIAGKIAIIDDIAYQTNMLALNAAIEAARAGDHGKGFAVVAAEVRKLAERSGIAAQEIGALAETSVATAVGAGNFLNEIVPGIAKTSSLVQEITAGSAEQAAGVNQINAAMNQLNQITQQNASAGEQLAATAEELTNQTRSLHELMGFFNFEVRAENENSEIDLDSAIEAHGAWKHKLSHAALHKEKLDSDTISRDDCCKLGLWLHDGASPEYRQLNSFRQCMGKHADFHVEAGKAAELINQQRYGTLDALLGKNSRFSAVSVEVVAAIQTLKRDIAR
ncbi:MAG: methyl-accepting chemotaxis protein [Methylomonas sp.]|nr:methyl-accepting chemotaxis protein [Methylomonas sp.]